MEANLLYRGVKAPSSYQPCIGCLLDCAVSIIMSKFRLSEAAEQIARRHLQVALPRRWLHADGVARRAASIANMLFAGADADVLKAAAWLHDLGYAPDIRDTGFHPLDGAVWLREAGFDNRVSALVAYHTCADI